MSHIPPGEEDPAPVDRAASRWLATSRSCRHVLLSGTCIKNNYQLLLPRTTILDTHKEQPSSTTILDMRKSPSCCRRLQSWTYKEQLSWPGRIYFPISSLWFNVGREWVIWPQSSLVLLRTFNLLVDENICWIMIKIVFQNKNMNWSHLVLNRQSMPGVDQNLKH